MHRKQTFVPARSARPAPVALLSARARACVVDDVEPARWDAAVRQFADHTVFHRRPWLEALAAAHGLDLVLLRATRGGRTAGVWPWLARATGPLRVAGSPLPGLGTPYGGPLFARGADVPAVLEAFLEHDVFRRSSWVACRVMDGTRPVDLGRFGFTAVRTYETSWLDLRHPEDVLWQRLKPECRTRVRRAEKLGVEVRREESPGFLDDFWEMTLETFARSGSRPTHTRAHVEEVWRRLHPAAELLALSAFRGSDRLGTVLLPFDHQVLYYWAGASFDRHRAVPAGNLLQWRAIVEAKRLGLLGYDLISANGGSGRFKKSFGATVVRVATHWERSSSPAVRVLRNAYEWWRLRRRRSAAPAVRDPDGC